MKTAKNTIEASASVAINVVKVSPTKIAKILTFEEGVDQPKMKGRNWTGRQLHPPWETGSKKQP